MAWQVLQFLCLQGCVPTTPVLRARCLTLTSLFFKLEPVRLTKLNTLGCGVLASSVLLSPVRLGEEVMVGSNFSTILMRFESLPYVVITLAVLGGEAGGVMIEAEE